jgi:signal transduction histidine kinase
VRIAVADSGIGIPEDARTNVFEPFFRVAGSATQHGEPSPSMCPV